MASNDVEAAFRIRSEFKLGVGRVPAEPVAKKWTYKGSNLGLSSSVRTEPTERTRPFLNMKTVRIDGLCGDGRSGRPSSVFIYLFVSDCSSLLGLGRIESVRRPTPAPRQHPPSPTG